MTKVKKIKEKIIAIFISLYFAFASTYHINNIAAINIINKNLFTAPKSFI